VSRQTNRGKPKQRQAPGAVRAIEAIFLERYKRGATEVGFTTDDLYQVLARLNLKLTHETDIPYRFKQGRSLLPDSIKQTAPAGHTWVVESVGRSQYRFVLYPESRLQVIAPDSLLQEIKIPNATPGLVANNRGPITMPWYCSTIIITAAVLPPGTPSARVGTRVPEVTPLLADSGAMTPSGIPLP